MKILVAWWSWLVGSALTKLLHDRWHTIARLSRSIKHKNKYVTKTFIRNPLNNEIDPASVQRADVIVNLTWANVAQWRRTRQRKKVLYESRIKSTILLSDTLKTVQHNVQNYISASAMGIYQSGNTIHDESSTNYGSDFLGTLTQDREAAVDTITKQWIRTSLIRISLVLSNKWWLLTPFQHLSRRKLLTTIGSGKQPLCRIHIDDLIQIFAQCIEDITMSWVYNGIAPDIRDIHSLVDMIRQRFGQSIRRPSIPQRIIRLIMREQATIFFSEYKVKTARLESAYKFQYDTLEKALDDLFPYAKQ